MIQVLIELHPGGDETRKRCIGLLVIRNDGTGTPEKGNYEYAISHAGKFFGKRKEPFKQGRIKGFPRKLSPYRLISRVLKDAMEV